MKTNLLSFPLPLRFAVGVVLSLFAPALFAQAEMPVAPKDSTVKYADRNFLKKAAKAGDEELTISTIAISRTSNARVKELAQTIVSDHQSLASRLSNLAASKGVELPAKEMGASKWEKKNGKDFDKDYLKEMVDQHEDAIELFSKAAKSDDATIAAFASQQLPTLQSHLSKAKDLLKTLD